MDRGVAVIAMTAVGGLIALQAPINAGLGKETGKFGAALVSFLVGSAVLAAIVLLSGKAGNVSGATEVSGVYLLGGVLGAAYVFTALLTVPTIGAGGVAAATITGQLTISVLIDRLGILGLDKEPITVTRLAGVALLLLGTYLVVR